MQALSKKHKQKKAAQIHKRKTKHEQQGRADVEWERVLAKNPDALAKLAEKARRDFEEGRTDVLDPDNL